MHPSGVWGKVRMFHVEPHPQEPVLFGTTIMENIRFGKLGATDEEVYAAAREANAHEFITSFPEGYNTVVGESQGRRPVRLCRAHGVKVWGQEQRPGIREDQTHGLGGQTGLHGLAAHRLQRRDATGGAGTGPSQGHRDPWCWDSSELTRGPQS